MSKLLMSTGKTAVNVEDQKLGKELAILKVLDNVTIFSLHFAAPVDLFYFSQDQKVPPPAGAQ